jgi:UDP-N-acetylenolpyruvoylglucosamine reductase
VSEVRDTLRRELPGLEEAVPLAPLCTYGVGGPAEFLYRATTTGALVHAIAVARGLGVQLTVLGQLTNVLVADEGLSGLVVLARNDEERLDGELLTVGAGAILPDVVGRLAQRGLAGLEYAGNIPGSVGGAVVGNAGAYGRAVGDVLVRVRLLGDGEVRDAAPAELGFGYRTSALKRRRDVVVLEAVFALNASERSALLDEIARDAELRRTKHPLEYGSCGSFFQNPSREVPAARLIQEAGLKGLVLGGAQVSEKHANFLVALPGASSGDVLALSAEVKRRVREHSGVELVEEVRRLGFGDGAPG